MKKDQMKDFIEETIAKEIKKLISESVSEVYIIKNKEGDPIEQFKTQEEANKALEVYKVKHPDQELIVEPGEELSFEELDKMSEKLENMENINETKHKGHFTSAQVMKLAKKAGEVVVDAEDDLMELCEMYGDKIPAHRVFEILDDYDMPELKSKIKVKKVEPKEEESMDEKLYGNQDKLDVDGDGEIEADDLAALRAKKKDTNEEEGECMECGADMKEDDHKETYYHVLQDSGYGEIGYQGVYDTEEEAKSRVNSLFDMFPNSFFYVEASNSEKEPYSVTSSDYNPNDDLDEGQGGMCEKCGKEICECGGGMMESKKSLRLTESELISLITNIVNESFPAAELQGTVHKKSGEQNEDALSDVEEKIKEYLNFDGNDNSEFPHQVGGEVKARRADEKEADEVSTHRGGGMEDLDYDVEPSKEFKERIDMALKGDVKMGNSQEAANVVPSKLGEKIIKKVKKKDQEESDAQMYAKAIQPSRETKKKDVVSEEIERMKQMASYNKKTQ